MNNLEKMLSSFLKFLSLCHCLQQQAVVASSYQEPFQAFWNVPSEKCYEKYGIDLRKSLAFWGVTVNYNRELMGDELSIWYSQKLGYYPYYSNEGDKAVNGGIPQLGNLTAHLQKAAKDIEGDVAANFSGLAIIDWESWRPTWERNLDSKLVYQETSKKLVQSKHPNWSDDQVEAEAKREFESSAKQWMLETLQLGKKLRPSAKWGFYHFPYCYNDHTTNFTCPDFQKTYNDQSMWLFNASTALYPSIYLGKYAIQDEVAHAKSVLGEALRIARCSSDPYIPVYAYSRFNYSHSNLYLTDRALNATMGQATLMGLDGVIIWGDNNDTRSETACQQLSRYIDGILGPFCRANINLADSCSRGLCNAQGRCQWEDDTLGAKLLTDPNYYPYNESNIKLSCRCYRGWSGDFCDQPIQEN